MIRGEVVHFLPLQQGAAADWHECALINCNDINDINSRDMLRVELSLCKQESVSVFALIRGEAVHFLPL